ncbi:MAG: hypothetical protein ACKO0Z_19060 [Betaproteobacteria bacterium]
MNLNNLIQSFRRFLKFAEQVTVGAGLIFAGYLVYPYYKAGNFLDASQAGGKPAERVYTPAAVEQIRAICVNDYKTPELVVDVLLEKESAGGNKDQLYRFEPGQMSRAQKLTRSDGEARMLASSHCPLHVMGMPAREMGIHWSDLYDPETCAKAGCGYWRKQYEAASKEGDKIQQLHSAFRSYNGAGPAAVKYANDAIDRLAVRLVSDYAGLM